MLDHNDCVLLGLSPKDDGGAPDRTYVFSVSRRCHGYRCACDRGEDGSPCCPTRCELVIPPRAFPGDGASANPPTGFLGPGTRRVYPVSSFGFVYPHIRVGRSPSAHSE